MYEAFVIVRQSFEEINDPIVGVETHGTDQMPLVPDKIHIRVEQVGIQNKRSIGLGLPGLHGACRHGREVVRVVEDHSGRVILGPIASVVMGPFRDFGAWRCGCFITIIRPDHSVGKTVPDIADPRSSDKDHGGPVSGFKPFAAGPIVGFGISIHGPVGVGGNLVIAGHMGSV